MYLLDSGLLAPLALLVGGILFNAYLSFSNRKES